MRLTRYESERQSRIAMTAREDTQQEYVRRAFELAYFIHADVGIALSITEAALCKLEHTFGKQDRRFHYVPEGRRQSEDRSSYALRTKVSLRREHLLQLLVLAESDSWERWSERGNSAPLLTEEVMAIRFIKHLVQITLKRNSFYVVLGVGRLLYEYETSQVRQMYDVLMQDQARFRDNSYLRKQKKVLMMEMIERFDPMIRIARTGQGEDRFVTQPTTQPLISLVNECLQRFTPWDTTCVVPASFDPAERIPALSFSGTDPNNESPIEMNRIHTIFDPDCFSRLLANLGLESANKRLAMPQFFFSDNKESRGDRFNPPPLTPEDQLQLQRAREDSARRRKAYRVRRLRIYVDNLEYVFFDPRRVAKVAFKFRTAANVIEVRGEDAKGELPLATMLVSYESLAPGQSLMDSVLLEGGQKLTIVITPISDGTGMISEVRAEMKYAETQPIRVISWVAQRMWFWLAEMARGRREDPEGFKSGYWWLVKAGVTVALIMGVLLIVWHQLRPAQFSSPAPRQVQLPPAPTREVLPPIPSPSVTIVPRTEKEMASLAQATWHKDPEAVTSAVRIQVRRGSVPSVEIPLTQTTQLIALNRADAEDRIYYRYRIVIVAAEKPIWQRMLKAPQASSSSRAHVLKLELSPQRFPKADSYSLRVEGETEGGWQSMGQIVLQLVSR